MVAAALEGWCGPTCHAQVVCRCPCLCLLIELSFCLSIHHPFSRSAFQSPIVSQSVGLYTKTDSLQTPMWISRILALALILVLINETFAFRDVSVGPVGAHAFAGSEVHGGPGVVRSRHKPDFSWKRMAILVEIGMLPDSCILFFWLCNLTRSKSQSQSDQANLDWLDPKLGPCSLQEDGSRFQLVREVFKSPLLPWRGLLTSILAR